MWALIVGVLTLFCLVLLAINTAGVIIFCLGVGAVLTTGNWLYALVCALGLWLMSISE